jgi:hypothetical protein
MRWLVSCANRTNALCVQVQGEAVRERTDRELEECTFKPVIHEAPEYIKRIAAHVRQFKQVSAQHVEEKSEKPAWRFN